MTLLRITEIFHSLQGEANTVGYPTVFVRLTGCPLRCQYCDTEYAFKGGEQTPIEAILQRVARYQTPYVTVTGGEPLAQPNCIQLLRDLADQHYKVSLETSGAMPIHDVDKRVSIVLDLKTPASLECHRNDYNNVELLKPSDQIKFVICDAKDFAWAKALVLDKQLYNKCEVLFSPSYHQLNPTDLANWIIAEKLPVRFQIQLHKILWGDAPGV